MTNATTADPTPRAIRVMRLDGGHYLLATGGIEHWWADSYAGRIHVKMTLGKNPVLVCGTVAEMDRAYGSIMQCRVPEGLDIPTPLR